MTIAGETNPGRGGEFNQDQRYEFHEIYRDVQERAEANYDN